MKRETLTSSVTFAAVYALISCMAAFYLGMVDLHKSVWSQPWHVALSPRGLLLILFVGVCQATHWYYGVAASVLTGKGIKLAGRRWPRLRHSWERVLRELGIWK